MDRVNKILVIVAAVVAVLCLGDAAYIGIEKHNTFCAYSIIGPRPHD